MITASLATLPEREALLERVVASVVPQVDHLNVFLDGHVTVPSCLRRSKIEVAFARDFERPLRGSGKFLWAANASGYQLTVDDDLIYPSDYVARMVAAVDRFERRALICVLGRRFLVPRPVGYTSPMFAFSSEHALDVDLDVHVPGTGTAAWHADNFTIAPSAQPFQDDMHMALAARQQNVRVVAVSRPADWIGVQHVEGFTTARSPGKIEGRDKLIHANAPWPALPLPSYYVYADIIRRYWPRSAATSSASKV